MITLKTRAIILLLITSFIGQAQDQNLLDVSGWVTGSGSVSGFNQNGTAAENSRELGYDHVGNQVTLWTATPDANGGASGGFTTTSISIDHAKTYRYTIWLKKTNSNDGYSYFGCYNNILNLDNSPNPNPYFWYGDLPQLNRWYLIVGYVHASNYAGAGNIGGIYDGVTGERVQSITDFKFASAANTTKLRSYLYNDSNVNDRQYFVAPRLEILNGTEFSLAQLMSINASSKLVFAFDNAGSQKQRFYCIAPGCTVPTPPAGKQSKNSIIVSRSSNEEELLSNEEDVLNNESQFSVYPNPTKNLVYIQIPSELSTKIESINVYNVNSALVQSISLNQNDKLQFSLQGKPVGVYFVHIHLNDGNSITKKIIKQ